MTSQTRATLKGYFNTNDQPTEAQFADLIDSGLNLADETNWTLGSGVDEYALVYDHDTARFVLRAPFAGLLATGATVGATSQAQAFTLGVVSPFLAPAADSTTAVQVRRADKATAVVTVDTTNARVGIGTAGPLTDLHIVGYGCALGLSGETNANDAEIASIKFSNLYHGTLDNPVAKIVARNLATYDDGDYALSFHTRLLGTLTEKVRIDNIGNVGIGTASPATALHVVGAATITGGIRPAADSTTALQLQTAAGASVLNVDTTNGYVGIGTAGPGAKLSVFGFNESIYVGDATSGITITGRDSGGQQSISSVSYQLFKINSLGALALQPAGGNVLIGSSTDDGVNKLQVTGSTTISGNVGIGDTAPAEKLDVTGNINATGVYKVDDVQVLSNRVIDARCADVANSGDATTDGLIDALRDAMIAHGLLAAAA